MPYVPSKWLGPQTSQAPQSLLLRLQPHNRATDPVWDAIGSSDRSGPSSAQKWNPGSVQDFHPLARWERAPPHRLQICAEPARLKPNARVLFRYVGLVKQDYAPAQQAQRRAQGRRPPRATAHRRSFPDFHVQPPWTNGP